MLEGPTRFATISEPQRRNTDTHTNLSKGNHADVATTKNLFAELPPHREVKVRLGNALCEIAVRMAHAQELAGNYWKLEQPATSLMWLFEPLA